MPKNLPDHWAGLGNTRISTDEAQKSPRTLLERNRSSLVEYVLIFSRVIGHKNIVIV